MKKLLTLVCLLVSMVSYTYAKDVTIYVKAGAAPNLYAWSTTGNMNGDFPGAVMTETVNYNGHTLYKKTFSDAPESFNIIFKHTGQTANIEGITSDAFFDYNGDTEYTVIDPAVTKVQLRGSFNEWTDAETADMELSAGVYSKALDLSATIENQEFKLYVTSGFGKAWVGITSGMTITPPEWIGGTDNIILKNSITDYKTYNFSATESNGTWSLTIEGVTPRPYITATFVNGNDWENVYAYAWVDGGAVEKAWPGTQLSKTGTKKENHDIYSYKSYNTSCNRIIFNNNSGSQTENFVLMDTHEYTTLATDPVYAVLGSNQDDTDADIFSGNWDAANTTDYLTKVGEIWTIAFNNKTLAKGIKFKVINKDYLESTTVKTWYPTGDDMTIGAGEYSSIVINFDGTNASFTATPSPATETFNITVEAGWATAKTTYAVDFTGITGIEAYTATVEGSTVTLHKQGAVPANTALVLKGSTKAVPTSPVTSSAVALSNDLKWYDYYKVNDSYRHVYGLVKGTDGKAQFTRVNDTQTITNKAILELAPSASRELKVVFDDETTGISQIENTQPATKIDGAIYNLTGQRVMNPGKGLYIINGKKFIMK